MSDEDLIDDEYDEEFNWVTGDYPSWPDLAARYNQYYLGNTHSYHSDDYYEAFRWVNNHVKLEDKSLWIEAQFFVASSPLVGIPCLPPGTFTDPVKSAKRCVRFFKSNKTYSGNAAISPFRMFIYVQDERTERNEHIENLTYRFISVWVTTGDRKYARKLLNLTPAVEIDKFKPKFVPHIAQRVCEELGLEYDAEKVDSWKKLVKYYKKEHNARRKK